MPHGRPPELEPTLQVSLSTVLSSRRPLKALLPAIESLDATAQQFVARWTPAVARTSAELAWRFCQAAPDALRVLSLDVAEEWVAAALHLHDSQGISSACNVIENWQSFVLEKGAGAVRLDEVASTLRHVLHALGAETLHIAPGSQACLQGDTLFLPECIDSAGTREGNSTLYKATLLMLWAQIRFGTFEANLEGEVARYSDAERALSTFNNLETARLDAALGRLFPGFQRDLAPLRDATAKPLPFPRLYALDSRVQDSLDALATCHADPPPGGLPYLATISRSALRGQVSRRESPPPVGAADVNGTAAERADSSGAAQSESDACDETTGVNSPAAATDAFAASMTDELLPVSEVPAPPTTHQYDEWDYMRSDYRKRWCTVREVEFEACAPEVAKDIVFRMGPTIRALRRHFARLAECDVLQRRQPDGDELDLDAFVDAWVDIRRGEASTPLAFTNRIRAARDLATLIMVDMSGSTQGWINLAEREALIVLCEALGTLDGQYAIYGFSGLSRQQCEIYPLKSFGERYDTHVRERIAAMEPQDYTRMGAAVRHLSHRLEAIDAHTRLLLVISDGRPDDYSDGYRGEYGIEDTRQALSEARAAGIRTFCITLDTNAREYLSRLYGRSAWAVVEDVAALPSVLASFYGKLAL